MSVLHVPWQPYNSPYLITGLMMEPKSYTPHAHNGGEIYLHIKGSAEYVIGGHTYRPKPYDLIIAREYEMHHLNCKSLIFDRIVIELSNCFFIHQQRELYKNIFEEISLERNHLFPAAVVKSLGINDAVMRTVQYLQDPDFYGDMAVLGVLSELLFLLNKAKQSRTRISTADDTVNEIITYIEENIDTPIYLDDIVNQFYISKPHLCRVFKTTTSLTINEYISHRRISLVEQLVKEGKSLVQACNDSGFGCYSNFYRVYVRENGKSPREKLLKT